MKTEYIIHQKIGYVEVEYPFNLSDGDRALRFLQHLNGARFPHETDGEKYSAWLEVATVEEEDF